MKLPEQGTWIQDVVNQCAESQVHLESEDSIDASRNARLRGSSRLCNCIELRDLCALKLAHALLW